MSTMVSGAESDEFVVVICSYEWGVRAPMMIVGSRARHAGVKALNGGSETL